MPAVFIAPIDASSSPLLPFVIAPIGKTLTIADRRARDRRPPRTLDDVTRDRRTVVHGRGIRHATHGREAARGSGSRTALDRLGVLEARLAQMDVHVDEPRGDDQPVRVEYLGAAPIEVRADAADHRVLDQHVGGLIESGAGVEHPPVADEELCHGCLLHDLLEYGHANRHAVLDLIEDDRAL
jgi:hypothetical protein